MLIRKMLLVLPGRHMSLCLCAGPHTRGGMRTRIANNRLRMRTRTRARSRHNSVLTCTHTCRSRLLRRQSRSLLLRMTVLHVARVHRHHVARLDRGRPTVPVSCVHMCVTALPVREDVVVHVRQPRVRREHEAVHRRPPSQAVPTSSSATYTNCSPSSSCSRSRSGTRAVSAFFASSLRTPSASRSGSCAAPAARAPC